MMSTPSAHDLTIKFAEWLELERRAYASAAMVHGLPLSTWVQRTEGHVEGNGVRYVTRSIETSSMAPFAFGNAISTRAQRLPSPEGLQLAKEFDAVFGVRLDRWTMNESIAPAHGRPHWIFHTYLFPVCLTYLRSIRSLGIGEPDRATQLALALEAHITAESLVLVESILVGGFDAAEDELSTPSIRVRRLQPHELGASVPLLHGTDVIPDLPTYGYRWALELRTDVAKHTQPMPSDFAERVLTAFALLSFRVHGSGRSSYWTEPEPTLIRGGQRCELPARGSAMPLDRQHLQRAEQLAAAMLVSTASGEIALHRFYLGAARASPSDSLLDYVTALEACLLPGDSQSELSYQFRLRGAWFLGATRDERGALLAAFKRTYEMRSRLVHGGHPHRASDVAPVATQARELAQRVLLKSLDAGWPSAEMFRDLVLGT